MQEKRLTDDLEVLLTVLPSTLAEVLRQRGRFTELIEIVMDLGRAPEARYSGSKDEEVLLRDDEVTQAEIDYVISRIGQIDDDNRAGITRTLHRISVIKNRRGVVVGITCRVGRAVYGTLEIIKDIITNGKSILLLGRPGVGKTTMLREAARVLADSSRVVIVDTSNEIGGDGDISHPAVGRARRMQVATPSRQHEVMIEAVENHNPQVIVIDEIGRAAEAEAARTIAERGVQLVGTAHGKTLENLMSNPTLSDLIGGIESVTLSDDEARRRHTQKTVLERRAPPTFEVLIEIQERAKLLVHHNVAEAVDHILRGRIPPSELRYFGEDGQLRIEKTKVALPIDERGRQIERGSERGGMRGGARGEPRNGRDHEREYGFEENGSNGVSHHGSASNGHANGEHGRAIEDPLTQPEIGEAASALSKFPTRLMQIFAFGLPRNRMLQAIRQLGIPAQLVDSAEDADVLITSKSYYRQRPRAITDAEHRNIPIYVLRSNSELQMETVLGGLFNLSEAEETPLDTAISDVEAAIQRVLAGERSVDLRPQNQFVRRKQHELARAANLTSHSYGKEPYRRVRVFRD
ncbi:MAG: AAA family ATPase [Anaerolineae bacterium]|nr:AAA family ATPase [Anaerolineae bacterium]